MIDNKILAEQFERFARASFSSYGVNAMLGVTMALYVLGAIIISKAAHIQSIFIASIFLLPPACAAVLSFWFNLKQQDQAQKWANYLKKAYQTNVMYHKFDNLPNIDGEK